MEAGRKRRLGQCGNQWGGFRGFPEIEGRDRRRRMLEGLAVTFGFGQAQFEIPVAGGSGDSGQSQRRA